MQDILYATPKGGWEPLSNAEKILLLTSVQLPIGII